MPTYRLLPLSDDAAYDLAWDLLSPELNDTWTCDFCGSITVECAMAKAHSVGRPNAIPCGA